MSYEELKDVAEDLYKFVDACVRNSERESKAAVSSLMSGEGPEEERAAFSNSVADMMKREGYWDSKIVRTGRGKDENFAPTKRHQKMRALCESIAQYLNEKEGVDVSGEDYFGNFFKARIMAKKVGADQKTLDDVLGNPYVISLYPKKLMEEEEADRRALQELNATK